MALKSFFKTTVSILLLLGSFHAQGDVVPSPKILKELMAPLTFNLEKGITLFHWTNETQDKDDYLTKRIEMFRSYSIFSSSDKFGRGLYLAIDPMVTHQYGKRVFAVRLNPHVRILNLQKANSDATQVRELFIRQKSDKKLKRILANLLREENISVVIYDYGRIPVKFCPDIYEQKTAPAFFILDVDAVDFDKSSSFDKNSLSISSVPEDYHHIEKLFRGSILPFPFPLLYDDAPYFDEWLNSETLICNKISLFQ